MTLSTDAATRKATPITSGVLDYFPDAIAAVAECSRKGNDQHNPGQPLHWARDKSTDHADCIGRHLIERGTVDVDGIRHAAKLAWRALALLQTELEAAQRPLAAGANHGTARQMTSMMVNGHIVPVIVKPGEHPSEAICRTTREAHGLPRMQEQHGPREVLEPEYVAPETKFGFTVGETVNAMWCPVGDTPGTVESFCDEWVCVKWGSDVKSFRYLPHQLRHGE